MPRKEATVSDELHNFPRNSNTSDFEAGLGSEGGKKLIDQGLAESIRHRRKM